MCGCSVCIIRPEAERSRIPMEPSLSVIRAVKTEYNWTEESIRALRDVSNESKNIMIEYLNYVNDTLPNIMDTIFLSGTTGSIAYWLLELCLTVSILSGYYTDGPKMGWQSKDFKYFQIDYDSDEIPELVHDSV